MAATRGTFEFALMYAGSDAGRAAADEVRATLDGIAATQAVSRAAWDLFRERLAHADSYPLDALEILNRAVAESRAKDA